MKHGISRGVKTIANLAMRHQAPRGARSQWSRIPILENFGTQVHICTITPATLANIPQIDLKKPLR